MTPHGGHGGGRRGGYGYPLLYGYPPIYVDVDDIAANFKQIDSDSSKSELQKQAAKLDVLTKKLNNTPADQTNLRSALQTEIAQTKNKIKKLSETSSFDGSTNQQTKTMGNTILVGSKWKSNKNISFGNIGSLLGQTTQPAKVMKAGDYVIVTNANHVVITQSVGLVPNLVRYVDYTVLNGSANGMKGSMPYSNWNSVFSKVSEIQSSGMSTASNFAGDTPVNSKTIAIPAVGAVAGYIIGKKMGFNPIVSALAVGVATFFAAKKFMASAPTISSPTTKPDVSNPATIKPVDNGSTSNLMSGIGSQGESFFSYTNENLDDERLFSSAEGETTCARNCPTCMSGCNCSEPFSSSYCKDYLKNAMKVNKPSVGSTNRNVMTMSKNLSGGMETPKILMHK